LKGQGHVLFFFSVVCHHIFIGLSLRTSPTIASVNYTLRAVKPPLTGIVERILLIVPSSQQLEFHLIILKLKTMKKIVLVTAAIVTAGFFISANAGINSFKSDKETKKLIRKEKREKRKELWMHSVNVGTENQFYIDFPGAKDVSWTESVFAEATFHDGDILKTAYYDTNQELVGTTSVVDYSALPDKAKKYIDKKYPGYSVENVILFDDNEANNTDMFLFNSPFADEDNYFPVLSKGSKQIILKVNMDGMVSFFQEYK
jgi:hypothetical protein